MAGSVGTEGKDEPAQSLRVFLSYSRKDGAFLSKLAEALIALGYEASYDASPHGRNNPDLAISAEDDWWKALEGMIAKADVMVFVVTRASAESQVCDEEIAYARRLGKRVIAILREEIDFRTAPPKLAALNVKLRFTSDAEAEFAASLAELKEALDLDAAWWREQKWFAVQLKDWLDAADRQKTGWLLSAAETERAELWAARRPPGAPAIADDERRFLIASREHVARQARNRRRMLGAVWAMTAIALVISVAGGLYVTDRQRDVARSQSLMMARASEQFLEAGDTVRAMRAALLASRDTFLSPAAPEAKPALLVAADLMLQEMDLRGHVGAVNGAIFLNAGSGALSWGEDKTVRKWDVASGAQVGEAMAHPFAVEKVVVGPDEATAVVIGGDTAQVWDLKSARKLGGAVAMGSEIAAQYTADGSRIMLWRPDHAENTCRMEIHGAKDGLLVGESLGLYSSCSAVHLLDDDGRILADLLGEVSVWDTRTSQMLARREGVELQAFHASPTGARAALGGGAGEIVQIVNGVTLQDIKALEHPQTARAAAISPDLKQAVTVRSEDGAMFVWDIATPAFVEPIKLDDVNGEPVYLPDGSGLAVWTGKEVTTYEPTMGRMNQFTFPGGYTKLASSADGASAIVSCQSQSGLDCSRQPALLLTSEGAQERQAGLPAGEVSGAIFSEDGVRFLTWSRAGLVRVWKTQPPRRADDKVPLGGPLGGGRIFASQQRAMIADEKGSRLIDLATGAELLRLPQEVHRISADGEWILSQHFSPPFGPIKLREARTGKLGASVPTTEGSRPDAYLSADGHTIVLYEGERRTDIVAVATGSVLATHTWVLPVFAPQADRMLLLARARDSGEGAYRNAQLVDLKTGRAIGKPLQTHDLLAGGVFSPDGLRLLTWGRNEGASVWDAATGARLAGPLRHAGLITGGAFSGDARTAATWSRDGVVRRWDAATGRPAGPDIVHGGAVLGAAWSPDGARVLTWSMDQTARISDAATGREIATFPGDTAWAQVSPDQTMVLVRGGGRAQLWSVAGEAPVGAPFPATFVNFLPDNRVIVEGLGDTYVFDPRPVMAAKPMDLVQMVCAQRLPGSTLKEIGKDGGLLTRGARYLDARDVAAAPILRGREGEDVCAWRRQWHDRALDFLFGWAG